ncbi:uncharacterized protein [Antedon mediterranea]|uniref:uncharacterized protein n=1 Tax=Antedon mediterranea TaxID=105859 RepID=UPI003AF8A74F
MFRLSLLLVSVEIIVGVTSQDTGLGYKPLRLVGGESDREGRVEIYHNGSWATVCDDRWDIRDAFVVCRQIGFTDAVNATIRSSFGRGEGEILYENCECRGDESSLNECLHSAFYDHDCSHGEDAGVICGGHNVGTGDSSIDDNLSTADSSSNIEGETSNQQSSSYSFNIQEASQVHIMYDLQSSNSESTPSEEISSSVSSNTNTRPMMDESIPSSTAEDDPCSEDKCENGATCELEGSNPLGYMCMCASEWTGTYCELTVLDNDTEEEEEFDNDTDYYLEPTEEYSSIGYESTRMIGSSIPASTVVTSPTTTMATTSLTEKSTQRLSTQIRNVNNSTTKNNILTNQYITKTQNLTQYSTQSEYLTSETPTNDVTTISEATTNNGHENVTNVESIATWDHASATDDLERVTVTTQAVLSTKELQQRLTLITLNTTKAYDGFITDILNDIATTTSGEKSMSTKNYDGKIETSTSNLNDKSIATESTPVLINGSASPSQSNSYFDLQTLVLIGLGIMIMILLILIAITLLKKRRTNDSPSPSTVVETGDKSDNVDVLSKSTEYTNIAFDNCETQTHSELNYSPKQYLESISSSIEISPSDNFASQTRQSNSDDVLNASTSHFSPQQKTIVDVSPSTSQRQYCQTKQEKQTMINVCPELTQTIKRPTSQTKQSKSQMVVKAQIDEGIEVLKRKQLYKILLLYCISFTNMDVNIIQTFLIYSILGSLVLVSSANILGSTVRLRGGSTRAEGRVEVYHNGAWGTVCNDNFNLNEAYVVCRQLGFFSIKKIVNRKWFGVGSGAIHLNHLKCTGVEYGLLNCEYTDFPSECTHKQDAGVLCLSKESTEVTDSRYKPVRLVDGETDYEGRVEILHKGKWSSICDDNWDIKDARVVCRQLGYATARAIAPRAKFGQGKGTILFDDTFCKGYEKYLNECPHSRYDFHDCSHGEDAGVVCENLPKVPESNPIDYDMGLMDYPQISSFSDIYIYSYDFKSDLKFESKHCMEDKCQNDATCLELNSTNVCVCKYPWSGHNCEISGLTLLNPPYTVRHDGDDGHWADIFKDINTYIVFGGFSFLVILSVFIVYAIGDIRHRRRELKENKKKQQIMPTHV